MFIINQIIFNQLKSAMNTYRKTHNKFFKNLTTITNSANLLQIHCYSKIAIEKTLQVVAKQKLNIQTDTKKLYF